MSTFAFRESADARHAYFVLLHTAGAPDVGRWSRYVEVVAAAIGEQKATVQIFAVTDGGGPDAAQRRALADAFAPDRRGAMTHVFTTSAFTRGIVTAFHWVARARAVAHLPGEFPTVCDQCKVPVRAVLDDLMKLQEMLPPVALLQQLVAAVNSRPTRLSLRRS